KHGLNGTRFFAPDISVAASTECCVEGMPAKDLCSSSEVCAEGILPEFQNFHRLVTEPALAIDACNYRPCPYNPLRWGGFETDVDASSPECRICIPDRGVDDACKPTRIDLDIV